MSYASEKPGKAYRTEAALPGYTNIEVVYI